MTQGVVFDLYGTLFIYGDMMCAWRDWAGVCHQFFAEFGYKEDSENLKTSLNGFFTEMPAVSSWPGMTVYESALRHAAERLNIAVPQSEFRRLADDSCAIWQKQIVLDPDALDVLRTLKERGLRLGLLSNYDHSPHIETLLKHHQLDSLFDVIMISEQTGYKKPQIEIFRLMEQRLGLAASELIYVGDHPEKDIAGAVGAGWAAALIAREGEMDRLHLDFYSDLTPGQEEKLREIAGMDFFRIVSLQEIPAICGI